MLMFLYQKKWSSFYYHLPVSITIEIRILQSPLQIFSRTPMAFTVEITLLAYLICDNHPRCVLMLCPWSQRLKLIIEL